MLAATRFMSRRASVLSRTLAITKQMSGVAGTKPPSNADSEPVVRFESTLGLRTYVLNRPGKLNALNDEMLGLLRPKIEEWDSAELVNVIAGSGAGRAFCAGGDVQGRPTFIVRTKVEITVPGVVTYASNDQTRHKAIDFFRREFDMDLLLASLRKPYVAILDGHTMGGGVGLCANAPFRVATENTIFSMPETKIGYCPDVGASYFLSRLDGQLGTYLALTGETLKGRDVFDHGFATHFIPARRIPLLLERLSNLETSDNVAIDRTLEELSSEREPEDPPPTFIEQKRVALDHAFRHDSVEKIFTDLELFSSLDDPTTSQWAAQTLAALHHRSPTSLKVALKAIRLGKAMTLSQALNMELKIATAFCNGASPDFATGVTAVLVEKNNKVRPNWNPSSLQEVTEDIVDRFFAPHSKFLKGAPVIGDREFVPLEVNRGHNKRAVFRYTLPTENDIRDVITGEDPESGTMGYTLDDLLEYFHDSRAGKMGVNEKVLEVVRRKTTVVDNEDGNFVWLRWNA
ncbi:3-hydroxyisobutyryl-coenzyme A hydrolase isoform 1 [Mycena metata]|uniref:3-hydroxyisobutyryl-CoA hydrolase n=1 Tax=Mycena metata TaxID=1033252 RepID=A0AAD7NM42_9AGAR|nr:3-hydroxyisobutyryl-coenzyme A hydrolase isoform 1 [Mycena metata]